jgi:hypothetical protein
VAVTFKAVKKESILVAAAIRTSGSYDLYYDGARVYTSKPIETKLRDVYIGFGKVFMLMDVDWYSTKERKKLEAAKKAKLLKKGEELPEEKEVPDEEDKPQLCPVGKKKQRVRTIDLKYEADIKYENSELEQGIKFEKMHFHKIKNHVNIFTNFCLTGTVVIVTHTRCISLFSLISEEWTAHFPQPKPVQRLFRSHAPNECIILLEDNSIQVVRQQKVVNTGEEQEPWEIEKSMERRDLVGKKLVDCVQDREDSKWIIFITNESKSKDPHDQDYGIYVYYDYILYDITDQIKDGFDPN